MELPAGFKRQRSLKCQFVASLFMSATTTALVRARSHKTRTRLLRVHRQIEKIKIIDTIFTIPR